ncbi:6353_t:CDS:1, partial [Gigaspora margarita]
DDILINYKFDEWINNLENSGDLDETKKQFLDNDKYGKESSDDHKYKKQIFSKRFKFIINSIAVINILIDQYQSINSIAAIIYIN